MGSPSRMQTWPTGPRTGRLSLPNGRARSLLWAQEGSKHMATHKDLPATENAGIAVPLHIRRAFEAIIEAALTSRVAIYAAEDAQTGEHRFIVCVEVGDAGDSAVAMLPMAEIPADQAAWIGTLRTPGIEQREMPLGEML